jgi:signal transduction histidine kinase
MANPLGFGARRTRFLPVLLFVVLAAALLDGATYWVYRKARQTLDRSLGERLEAIASTLTYPFSAELDDTLGAENIPAELVRSLKEAQEAEGLVNVVLLDPEGRTLLDLGGLSEPGELNPFVFMDRLAFYAARSGTPAATTLYRVGSSYLKSAYAPLFGRSGRVVAVLGVEAGASFFADLALLGRSLALADGVATLALLLLGAIWIRQAIALDRLQAAALHQEQLASMGRMIATIAHEVRNPLGVIRTATERILRKGVEEEELFRYILEEVDELDRILRGYLNFARSGPVHLEPLDWRKPVERAVRILEPEARRRGILLDLRLPDQPVPVRGDGKRLQQATMNLLLNALEALQEGGKVEVLLEQSGEEATLRVADDGPGIPPRLLQEVRRPFFTTKAKGSGLGLSVVEGIMESHRGRMELRSEEGRGTTVTLRIPLASSTEPEEA